MDEATLLGTASLPRDYGTLYLFRRGDQVELTRQPDQPDSWVDASSQLSREALAQHPAKILSKKHQPKVLISGLGYTLAELLRQLSPQAQVEVSEWLPEMLQWHEEPLAETLGAPLQDKRVTVNDMDIARILRAKQNRYDAILLDTDNGPEDLLFKENDWLYTFAGLSACFEALEPMGVLAIWSPVVSDTLKGKLVRAGFMVEQRNVPANNSNNEQHVIWIAEKLQQD